VREPAIPGDHVEIRLCLAEGELEDRLKMQGGLTGGCLGLGDDALHSLDVIWTLCMSERQEKEELFPWAREGIVVTVPHSFLCDAKRIGIRSVRLCSPGEEATWKLVEDDQK
jgi:hypothetical protein